MKICLLGRVTSLHLERLAVWFIGRGHEVHIITFVDTQIKNAVIHYVNLRLNHLPVHLPFQDILSLSLDIKRIKDIIREIEPDIVNGQYLTHYGLYAACTGFHPLVLTAWGSDVLITPRRFFFVRPLTKYAVKKADLVICRTPLMKDELINLGADPVKTEISFPGVNTEQFSPANKDEKVRQILGISSSSPMVMSTRGLSRVYDVETLIRAAPLVIKEFPLVKFVIAGDGSQRDYLQKLVQKLGIDDSTRFVGWVPHEEMPRYLASADVYVSTSFSDGVPNSLLEAMASGSAPVVSDIAANRPWVKNRYNGILFPVRDYDALAARIAMLLRDDKMRIKYGGESRKIAVDKAEHHQQMEKLEQMYQNLLGRNPTWKNGRSDLSENK